MDAEQLRHAIKLCAMLKSAAPNCFYRLYESDLHCIYAWEPRLRRRINSTAAGVAGMIESCSDETCICKKLAEISARLPP
jgi:hypothetical protein